MQLVEKHILKNTSFLEVCVKAKNLYNQSLYYWRQSIFGNIEYFSEYELTALFAEFNEENYRSLPAQTSQQVIKTLFKNIKSWQKARKEYAKNPSKFLGRPKMPKYKKETSICFFTNQQIKLKDGFVHFPKQVGLPSVKTKQNNVQQVRIIPHINHCVIEIVYNVADVKQKEYNGNWMGIDLGLNNLAINNDIFNITSTSIIKQNIKTMIFILEQHTAMVILSSYLSKGQKHFSDMLRSHSYWGESQIRVLA